MKKNLIPTPPPASHPSIWRSCRAGLLGLATIVALAISASSSHAATGSIQTKLNADCTGDQVNLFCNKEDVNVSGANLPNGTYYLKVTNPSGQVVLGDAAGYVVSDGTLCLNLVTETGGFDDTTNPGGVYKVSISKNADFSDAKSDNFKIKCTDVENPPLGLTCPTVSSYCASGECTVSVNLTDWVNGLNPTGGTGPYTAQVFIDGNLVYDGDIPAPAGETASVGVGNHTYSIFVSDSEEEPNAGSCEGTFDVNSQISGHKFFFDQANNVEIPLAGWRIQLKQNDVVIACQLTGTGGSYSFDCLTPGLDYVVEEGTATGWTAVSGTSITVTDLQCPAVDQDFDNFCLQGGGGLTLGFWSNKNGCKEIQADDLLCLRNLNLRNANGTAFDPTTVSQFQTWILSANAVNMANMLSAQLAAMKLNVHNGHVSGDALVYSPCLNGGSFISISALIAAADASLAANGLTTAAGAARTAQECLKTTLDRANNNLNFACGYSFSCPPAQ